MISKSRNDRFVWIIGVLAVVSVVCIIYLLLPANRAARLAKRQQIDSTRKEVDALKSQVLPLRGIDKKIAQAKLDIAGFYNNRFPDRYSSISDTINTLASQNHVQLTNVTYTPAPSDVEDLQQVVMRATLSGQYGDVMRYIDALDHSRLFLLIDDVGLQRQQKEGTIQLTLTLETYLRTSAAPATAAASAPLPATAGGL